MTIILLGYMGSGKSTVGRLLAEILNYAYLDLDDYIEEKERQSIPELFKDRGEIYFRKKESLYLTKVLSMENTVVALGGGTPCYGANIQTIVDAHNAKSFYLKCSVPILVDRLFEERTSRPLIAHVMTKAALTEFVGKHLFERAVFYRKAQKMIFVDGKSAIAVAEEIVSDLF